MTLEQKYIESIDKTVLNEWIDFVVERYKIHIKKDIEKLPQPWSDDILFQTYSFTNVRRIEDTVTKFVYNKICNNPSLTMKQKVCNLLWFRIFNAPQTFNLFNFPIKESMLKLPFQDIASHYMKMYDQNTKLSRGAYMNSGTMKRYNDYQKGYPTSMMPFIRIWYLYNSQNMDNIIDGIQNNKGQKVFDIIQSIKGIGEFLAFQIYVDLSYIKNVPFTQNDFVYLGQGALKGVKYACPGIPSTKAGQFIYYTQQHLNQWLFERHFITLENLMSDLPLNERNLTLSNIQNCYCEFSKYKALKIGRNSKTLKYGKDKDYDLGE